MVLVQCITYSYLNHTYYFKYRFLIQFPRNILSKLANVHKHITTRMNKMCIWIVLCVRVCAWDYDTSTAAFGLKHL